MNKEKIKQGQKVGFIGCGRMASAIIKGVLGSNYLEPSAIMASEISEEFALIKKKELSIEVVTDNRIVVQNSDIIFLATKPHLIKDVIKEINGVLKEEKLIVSIAAGISTKTIEETLKKDIAVIRVMPNAPALILEGMSGVARGKFAKEEHAIFVEELLSKIGKCLFIDEDKIDILTAISGSGPAFFYQILNQMALAGEKLGLDYNKSLILAAQTAIGSAKLLLQSDSTPAKLVEGVATKGGCTEVGINYMSEQKTQELFYGLIKKTADKAKALGD